jgi:hypothetical protein
MSDRRERPGYIAGRALDEWNAAYVRVEAYFTALRVANKLLLAQLVARVLERAIRRAERDTGTPTMLLATEEMEHLVTEWIAEVLAVPDSAADFDPLLAARGRLGLLLADMPGRWQDQLLKPGPWPEEFVTAMRETYLRAGPDFQFVQMAPRPIDLGPVTVLAQLSDFPFFRAFILWLGFAGLLVALFQFTR